MPQRILNQPINDFFFNIATGAVILLLYVSLYYANINQLTG